MSLVYCAVYTYIREYIYQIIFACPSSQDEVAFGIVFTTIQMHNNTVPCNNQLRTRKDYAAINNMQQSTWTVKSMLIFMTYVFICMNTIVYISCIYA